MRASFVFLAVALLIGALAVGDAAGPQPPNPRPLAGARTDIDPWFIGDEWTYATKIRSLFPNGTDMTTTMTVTTQVAEFRAEVVNGTTYTLYNTTATGTFASSGDIFFPGAGAVPYTLSGTLSGWTWTDRSDLAVVRANQTLQGTGTVQILIFTYPVSVDSAATTTFLPAAEEFDFPLELGDAWSYDLLVNTSGFVLLNASAIPGGGMFYQDISGNSTRTSSLAFATEEDVTVLAGTFLAAARIEAGPSPSYTDTRWYHPSAKNLVRSEAHSLRAPNDYTHVWVNLTAYTLVPPAWPGTLSLSPSRVNPGGWVTASGTAIPGEDLVVRVAATGAVYPVSADGSGSWSVRILAPGFDDFTPANADVGSHGVSAEPMVGGGFDVATVQLVTPDLYVLPSDFSVSDPNPPAGTPIDVNGTVRLSPKADVTTPFNVSFAVDGSELQRFEVAALSAGGSVSFGISWTAVPGTHTLSIAADVDDVVGETDEGNNTMSLVVGTLSPDYLISRLVAPAKISVSMTATIYVDVRNAALVTANRSVDLLVYEGASPTPIVSFGVVPLGPGETVPFNFGWTAPATPGTVSLRFVIDSASVLEESNETNNEETHIVDVRDLPMTTVAWMGPNVQQTRLYVKSSTTFSLVGTDRSGSGLIGSFYRIDGGVATRYVQPFSISGDGPHSLEYWSEDLIGGIEPPRAVDVSVDDTPPTTSPSVESEGPDQSRVTLNASEGGVGVAYVQFRVDGQPTWRNYTTPFVVLGPGQHLVSFRSADLLGNEEPTQTFEWDAAVLAAPTANLKPILAGILAAILLALGFFLRRRHLPTRTCALPVAFGGIEAMLGLISALTGFLAVPPIGTGLAVNATIFGLGLASAWWFSRGPRGPAGSDAGTAK